MTNVTAEAGLRAVVISSGAVGCVTAIEAMRAGMSIDNDFVRDFIRLFASLHGSSP
ncbi:hypothetical protein [Aquabacterium humicola]|uniref:hypothetical protein n=1 Tax=Aquabacterium humicola TaxID=3237377 RepID=UPI00254332B0|nr:hypothetical protein [Rubrivivax pictus]